MSLPVQHTLDPWIFPESEILILGSFPSPKSRERAMYYGNPQNRFWQVLAALWDEKVPSNPSECQAFLKRHRLALWDVIASCRIKGASDTSITDVIPNDIPALVKAYDIQHLFLTGRTAEKLYNRYLKEACALKLHYLPSPSAANARYRLADLIEAYQPLKSL